MYKFNFGWKCKSLCHRNNIAHISVAPINPSHSDYLSLSYVVQYVRDVLY